MSQQLYGLKALLYLPSWALQDVGQCLGTARSSVQGIQYRSTSWHSKTCSVGSCLLRFFTVSHILPNVPGKMSSLATNRCFKAGRGTSGPDYFQLFAYHFLSQGKAIRPLFKQILAYRLGSGNIHQILKGGKKWVWKEKLLFDLIAVVVLAVQVVFLVPVPQRAGMKGDTGMVSSIWLFWIIGSLPCGAREGTSCTCALQCCVILSF